MTNAKARFHASINAAVKSLTNPKHGANAANYVVVQISQNQFDVQHKNAIVKGAAIVLDGANIKAGQ